MSYEFLAHVVRDVFPNNGFTIIYDSDFSFREILAKPEHGIGAYCLHTERDANDFPEYAYFWEAGWNHPFFSPDSADLLICLDYEPELIDNYYHNIAIQIGSVLKPGGLVLLINPGIWASELDSVFSIRYDLIKECKRYKFLSEENVIVYENI